MNDQSPGRRAGPTGSSDSGDTSATAPGTSPPEHSASRQHDDTVPGVAAGDVHDHPAPIAALATDSNPPSGAGNGESADETHATVGTAVHADRAPNEPSPAGADDTATEEFAAPRDHDHPGNHGQQDDTGAEQGHDAAADHRQDHDGDGDGGGRGRRVGVVAGVVVALLGVAYGVLYLVAGGTLARGATVAGIDVGGLTPADAKASLTEQLPSVVDRPVHLVLGDGETSYEIIPSEAGLSIDVAATVDNVPGGSANPVSLIRSVLGAGDVAPVPAVDREAVTAAVEEITAGANTEPVNGAVAFEDGEVVTSPPQPGRVVNVDATADRLVASYFGDESAALPIGDVPVLVEDVEPAVTSDEVDRAVREFAEPAMSAPVTVVAGEQSADIPVGIVSQALSMKPDEEGILRAQLDGAKLSELAHDVLADIGQEGRNATVTIEDGAPVVVPAEPGRGVAGDALSAAVLPALTQPEGERRAAVELAEVEPDLTTEEAEALGVTDVVSEFTTSFPHAEYRNVNIGTAAAAIDDTLLRPGDEFSLNDIVGERTEANGFTAGTIINGGRLVESLGGGVSQVATTTFHAAYVAGFEDVEHWPHSIYFDRYPVGQEATVAWGAKDMRFANDSPYGVVVDTVFTPSTPGSDGSLTVQLWSTEHYRVETSLSERYDYTSPRTIYDTSSSCSPQSGSQGFSITSYRQVWGPDGKLLKDESDPWTYNPNHEVVCGPDPDDGEDTGSNESDDSGSGESDD